MPTMIINPQANTILERIHAVLGNMLHTSQMDGTDMTSDRIDTFVTDAEYAVHATHHTLLWSLPAAAIF